MSHPICPPHCQCDRCREERQRQRDFIASIMKPRSEPMSDIRLEELRAMVEVSRPGHVTFTRFDRRLLDALFEAVAEIDRLRDMVVK